MLAFFSFEIKKKHLLITCVSNLNYSQQQRYTNVDLKEDDFKCPSCIFRPSFIHEPYKFDYFDAIEPTEKKNQKDVIYSILPLKKTHTKGLKMA